MQHTKLEASTFSGFGDIFESVPEISGVA